MTHAKYSVPNATARFEEGCTARRLQRWWNSRCACPSSSPYFWASLSFGRAMSVAQLLNAAAREGCRERSLKDPTQPVFRAAVLDQVVKTVGCPEQNVAVDITVTRTSGQQSTQAIDVSAAESRDLITVKVSVPYSAISYSLSKFLTARHSGCLCDETRMRATAKSKLILGTFSFSVIRREPMIRVHSKKSMIKLPSLLRRHHRIAAIRFGPQLRTTNES